MSLYKALLHGKLSRVPIKKESEDSLLMALIFPETIAPAALLLPPIILAIENDADREFLTQIYLDYRNLMYKVALTFFNDNYGEAEDAFSAVLEKMCKRPEILRGVSDKRKASYIATMTANACRDRLRHMKRGPSNYSLEDGTVDYN